MNRPVQAGSLYKYLGFPLGPTAANIPTIPVSHPRNHRRSLQRSVSFLSTSGNGPIESVAVAHGWLLLRLPKTSLRHSTSGFSLCWILCSRDSPSHGRGRKHLAALPLPLPRDIPFTDQPVLPDPGGSVHPPLASWFSDTPATLPHSHRAAPSATLPPIPPPTRRHSFTATPTAKTLRCVAPCCGLGPMTPCCGDPRDVPSLIRHQHRR